MTKTAIKDPVK